MGACLSQPDKQGRMHPVAFLSKKFQGAEVHYDTHDKELLAIVEAMRSWRPYMESAPNEILVWSDHHNLQYFTTTKVLNGRQVRWYEELSSFKFRIKH